MPSSISIVIPARNEEAHITDTLLALQEPEWATYNPEIIVVDDGSTDATFQIASRWVERVIRHPHNCGKGQAMQTGWLAARGKIIVFLDADLGASARHAWRLIEDIEAGRADMTIAVFPSAGRRGGFGLVKKLARNGIYFLSGYQAVAPLSGQRALKKSVLQQIGGLQSDYGIEVGLTIDVARKGLKISEVAIPLYHREMGRSIRGFLHRGKQFVQVSKTLFYKWRESII